MADAGNIIAGIQIAGEIIGAILENQQVRDMLQELADETDSDVDDLIVQLIIGIFVGQQKQRSN